MHNLNRQILRGAGRISVNMCVFSDAYIFHDKHHRHVYFSVVMFKTNHKRQYERTSCQSNTKKTNLSCICQKSELNRQEIGYFGVSVVFWYFGDSSDRSENNFLWYYSYYEKQSRLAYIATIRF